MVATLIFIVSSAKNANAQASMVAPVVKTSSHISICFCFSCSLGFMQNASFIFVTRSVRLFWVWLSVSLVRNNAVVLTGIPKTPAMPWAITVAWLKPLFASFLGCSGTGTITSIFFIQSVANNCCPNKRPRYSAVPFLCWYLSPCNKCCNRPSSVKWANAVALINGIRPASRWAASLLS